MTEKPVRADAHRNRERLLESARGAFSSDAEKVSLEAIARDAGVGIGTLYRHFPTREALVEAVYRSATAPPSCSRSSLPLPRSVPGWTGSGTT
jgi:AcrR family transcriptional regulator